LGVTIEEAKVAPGQPYWRVVEIIWHDEEEAGGRHAIFLDVLDENGDRVVGQPVKFGWLDGEEIRPIRPRPAPEYGTYFPMYAAGHSYHVQVEGVPSEVGLGTIEQRDWTIHVEYLIKFQRAVKE